MVQKLSTFLSTSLVEASLDSAGVRAIVQEETILLDSGTSGNYVKDITAGPGITVTGSGAHSASVVLDVDSNQLATRTSAQTLTNKTINLTNNTLSMTLTQLNNAISGGQDVASLTGTETLTNKTLTSPTISNPNITGPASLTDVTTFGLRDTITNTYETRVVSTNVSPTLTADRTLTIDVNNNDRSLSLSGDLNIRNTFTSGADQITLNTTGTTALTLPTSGTVISKDGSGNFSIAGTMTGDVDRDTFTTVTSGTYGSSQTIPIVTVNASGFVDSIGSVSVSGTTGATFDSSNGVFTISTTGGNYSTRISLGAFSTDSLAEGSNLYYTDARARAAISVTDAGGDGSLGYVAGTGVITYTGPSASETRAHFSAGSNILISSGEISTYDSMSISHLTLTQTTGSGVSPLTVSSTVLVSNLNADLLDGQHGSHYRIDVYDASGTLLN